MDAVVVGLRLVHIGAAILWAGGGVLLGRYLIPTSRALGPVARPFVERFEASLGPYFPITATVTVLAGTVLYWMDASAMAQGDVLAFLTGGGMGTGLGVGGIAAWLGWLTGLVAIAPTDARAARLDAALKAAGEPPPPALVAERAVVRARAALVARIELACLVVAIVAMATARYWP